MLWVVLWALGVIAFLVFFFRGHLRLFLLWVLILVAFIASAVLQAMLMESGGYGEFVGAAAQIGRVIVIVALTVLVADVAAMIVYAFRHGESDGSSTKAVTQKSPLRSMSLGYGRLMGRSKIKRLVSKSGFVTMESLVDGTATLGERMMVVGIITLFISFFLVFVGTGLMLMNRLLIMVLAPVIPGLFIYRAAREAWSDYRNAKKKVRAHV